MSLAAEISMVSSPRPAMIVSFPPPGRYVSPTRSVSERTLPPVKLLVRAELDTLAGHPTGAQLLTTLAGGSLRVTSAELRRIVDTLGAQVRTILVDHGRVLGVGRATSVPPGWLRDTLDALHDTCTAPGCRRAARTCDADHATTWHPASPGDRGGTTDLDNLGPLCAATNRGKERDGWKVTQTHQGVRIWHHPRSGMTIRTIPATWRPAGWRDTRRPGARTTRRSRARHDAPATEGEVYVKGERVPVKRKPAPKLIEVSTTGQPHGDPW